MLLPDLDADISTHSCVQSFQRRKKEKKVALPPDLSRSGHRLSFSDNNYWLMPNISEKGGFRLENLHA